MAEVPLYPWFIQYRFHFISGFDKGWFDETDVGLVPTDINAKIWCQAKSYSWDCHCQLPHAIDTDQIHFAFEDGAVATSKRAYPQQLSDGGWVGRAWFEQIWDKRDDVTVADIIALEEGRWRSLLNNGRDEESPREEVSLYIDEDDKIEISVEEASHQGFIAHTLWKSGNPIPKEWKKNEIVTMFSSMKTEPLPLITDFWG